MHFYKGLTEHYSITTGGQIFTKLRKLQSVKTTFRKNLIDYKEFMLALKSTRIRRPFHSQPNLIHILETEMNTSISNLWSRGTEYTIKIGKLMHNSF